MKIIKGFKDGWNKATKFYNVTMKYNEKCNELSKDLIANGLTEEDWKRFAFKDIGSYGIGYSIAGFFFFVTHGEISRLRN